MILFLLFPVLVLGEVELPTNISANVTTEEDESFQGVQEHIDFSYCNELVLENAAMFCSSQFDEIMVTMDKDTWCDWEEVIRPYNNLTACLELVTAYVGCSFPNNRIQELFFKTHSQYFQDCYTEEELPLEAPEGVVLVLTLAPIGIMIVLVFLVAFKSKEE